MYNDNVVCKQQINDTLKGAMSNIVKLENLAKDDKSSNEKLKKHNHKLMLKTMNLRTELDGATAQIEDLDKGLFENEKNFKIKSIECSK